MKLSPFFILFIAICPCFSKHVNLNQQNLPSDFYRFKKLIDSKVASDTVFANKCSIKVVDTTNIDVDSAYAKNANTRYSSRFEFVISKLLKGTIVPCKGQHLWINDYSHVSIIAFNNSNSVRFIGQSSHDEKVTHDFMMLKFSDSLYAYTNEHICGAASIEYINDSIAANQLLLGKTIDDKWHLVKFKKGAATFTDYQSEFGK